MLYKLFMDVSHLEAYDRVGMIEAPSIGSALDVLTLELERIAPGADRRVERHIETSLAGRLTVWATDNTGETAEDVYLVVEAGAGVALFHGDHWADYFS